MYNTVCGFDGGLMVMCGTTDINRLRRGMKDQ